MFKHKNAKLDVREKKTYASERFSNKEFHTGGISMCVVA